MYRMALMALIAGDVPGLNRERFEFDIEFLFVLFEFGWRLHCLDHMTRFT